VFSFLNPIILLAAGAAILLPLLIHIFNRQKVKTIPFSSLLFLRSLEKTRMRRVKIVEYLLLVIRTLIILLVVAAFARPAIKGGFATKVGAHAKTSVVILLDNSYSMGYDTKDGPVFKLAKARAEQILAQLEEGDEASLILFASQPEPVTSQPTSDFKNLTRHLEETALSAEITDVGAALHLGYRILGDSKNLNREMYLITDMDRTGWSDVSTDLAASQPKNAKLFVVDIAPGEKQNLSLEKIDFGNQLIEKGRPFQISAQVVNHGPQPARSTLVGLYLDGKRISQTDVDVEKEGKITVRFAPTVEQAGIHTGFFELTDDDLLIDNRRFFAFRIPEKTRVLLVGQSDRDTRHLGLALNPVQSGDASKEVTRVDLSSLPGVDFNRYQVVIFCNLSRLSEVQLSNLERFVQKGGGVFFMLGDNVDPEFYRKDIVGGLFGFDLRDPLTATKNSGGFFSFDKIDLEHPIFQVYREVEKGDAPTIKFSSIFELPESGKDTKTLIRFNLGKPALVEKSLGTGKMLLLAAPLDETQGDLVIHPFFVPMINRSVEYLASDLTRLNENILVGSEVFRELPADLAGKEIEVVDPQMKRTSVHPSFQTDKLVLNVSNVDLPGIYSIRVLGSSADQPETVDRFAVNVDPRDSDPGKIEVSELEKKLQGTSFAYLKPQDDLAKSILQSRYGKELWKTFLWVAFGLVALEMILSRSRRKETTTEEKT
jgi:hypothetical protein